MSNSTEKRVVVALILGTLLGTAFFLAQGTTGLLGASLLEVDRTISIARAGAATSPTRPSRKDDTQILRRNIFDSETGPLDGSAVEVEAPEIDEPEVIDPNAPPPPCEGSIRLVASVVNRRREEWSFAAIIGTAGSADIYRMGQSIDGKELIAVMPNSVWLKPSNGNNCSVTMFQQGEQPARPVPARPAVAAAAAPAEVAPPGREGSISSADLEAGIRRNSDTNFTIQRSLVDQVLANQAELMRTARVIPHEEEGRTVGVKLYGIRRNSLLGRLGVQNGDMLRTINGYDMTSPDSALEAYTRLRTADHLTLAVVRRGQAMTLDYAIQ